MHELQVFSAPWRGREGRVASSNKQWVKSCRTRLPNTADLLLPWLPTCHHLTWPVASRASRVQTLLGVVMLCDIWNNTFIWNSCYNEEDIVCVREKCGYGACSCGDLLPHGGQSAVQVNIMRITAIPPQSKICFWFVDCDWILNVKVPFFLRFCWQNIIHNPNSGLSKIYNSFIASFWQGCGHLNDKFAK